MRNPHAARLRAAGLRATSARIAVLQVMPEVLVAHGHATPQLLWQACGKRGYTVHRQVFYRLLPDLVAAGLVPLDAIRIGVDERAGN
ncbi:hypothetical protein [Stenotrophomonas tumulicola]|uniref:Fur family transcriptional regulator n=1 Tax=Stenotrophomonas tumulicola TaxID=1685415 RepID=A0A7W3FJV6_9GAMM|nr:hypothetical protein [Stenotrophomonas tumulicola]MBA8680904.1 hypothetical protein [Stenotrophomonas tumulicola]